MFCYFKNSYIAQMESFWQNPIKMNIFGFHIIREGNQFYIQRNLNLIKPVLSLIRCEAPMENAFKNIDILFM